MRWRRPGPVVGLVLGAVLALPVLPATPTVPGRLVGEWRVQRAAVDGADQPHWDFKPDDPRLVGRFMRIAADGGVRFNDGSDACSQGVWQGAPPRLLAAVIGERMPRSPGPGRPARPRLADLTVPLVDQRVTVWRVRCRQGEGWDRPWWSPLQDGRLLVGWSDSVVLLLVRSDTPPPVLPGFACQGPLSPAAAAICATPALAAYDRSVADAYERAARLAGPGDTALTQQQRAWLAEREACGAEASCLEDRMRDRLDRLMQY